MNTLDKVIEKYNGVHRRSILEYDAQNIYNKTFDIILVLEHHYIVCFGI